MGPEYAKYYYATKNINPRLPPPITSRGGSSSNPWADMDTPQQVKRDPPRETKCQHQRSLPSTVMRALQTESVGKAKRRVDPHVPSVAQTAKDDADTQSLAYNILFGGKLGLQVGIVLCFSEIHSCVPTWQVPAHSFGSSLLPIVLALVSQQDVLFDRSFAHTILI